MSSPHFSDSYQRGHRQVKRIGYGAMQLAGPGVFGPPADPAMCLRVLQDAVAAQGISQVPFSPLQSEALNGVAARVNATPMQVALAWLLTPA